MRTDEKTGMQANERAHLTRPLQPGLGERVAFAYLRHGTPTLIATCEVATGHVLAPAVGPTRTAADVVSHVAGPMRGDPAAAGIFVVDRLNPQPSASLVRFVAHPGGIHAALGVTGTAGL